MSEQPIHNTPFITLGKHLRYLREQSKESMAEVSGAVEIDEPSLARFEAGFERPAEEILLLLISHFGMPNQEALQLWELAGYDGDIPEQLRPQEDIPNMPKGMVMVFAVDMRTMYTDSVEIAANQAGVTMSFSQSSGQSKPNQVARLGMSYEQAEQTLIVLQRTLLQAKYLRGPKVLPPPPSDRSRSNQDDN